jgi:RNA polymerase sigma factor (TIGR02999 family)
VARHPLEDESLHSTAPTGSFFPAPLRAVPGENHMTDSNDHDVTRLLDELRLGTPGAADRLALRVHEELHRIAVNAMRRESAGHTLQPTELVGEAFMRLLGQRSTTWQNRSHFFAIAAQTIRRILVDHARQRRTRKRDGGLQVTFDESLAEERPDSIDMLALDLALQKLEALSPRQAKVVELRFFGGLDVEQTAEVLAISAATVKRDWAFARAFLLQTLAPTR